MNRHFSVFGINFIEAIAELDLPLPAFALISAFPTPCSIHSKNFSWYSLGTKSNLTFLAIVNQQLFYSHFHHYRLEVPQPVELCVLY